MARTFVFCMFSLGLCLTRIGRADESATIPSPQPKQVNQTVDRGIGYLQTEGAAWLKTRGCAACHHVSMAVWALSEADRQGYAIDRKFLADTVENALGSPQKMIASKLVNDPAQPPDPRPLARGVNMGTVFMAVAARSLPSLNEGQRESLRQIADDIARKQQNDGSWEFFLRRPPINESQATDTAWIIMALQGQMASRAASDAQRVALQRGTTWLEGATPRTYQEKVLKTLLAIRAGKAREQIQTNIDELLALQQDDGGWRQIPEMNSDAFATGQTLYVLAQAGYTSQQTPIKRGIEFLMRTQKPNGSWAMTSRATPDGRPGSAKLLTPITTAATAWATMALAGLAPLHPAANH